MEAGRGRWLFSQGREGMKMRKLLGLLFVVCLIGFCTASGVKSTPADTVFLIAGGVLLVFIAIERLAIRRP